MARKDVYWNNGESPVFIVAKWSTDKAGGPAIHEMTYCVEPGQGIDLSILGFSRKKEKDVEEV